MRNGIKPVDECRVCGRSDWLGVISFGDTPLAGGLVDPYAPVDETVERRYPLDVAVCRECWLMSLRHVVDPEVLFKHYLYISSDSDQIRGHTRRIADFCTRDAKLAEGDLVVELGSNIGTQLELFQQAGMRVLGVDPAQNLAEIANERGVNTLPDFFTVDVADRIVRDYGRARLVLGRQCFAHIHDVHDVLRGVTALLSHEGLVAIEVPYVVELLDKNQFDTIFHEHLSYFSLGTLRRLFAAHGLNVVDVLRADVHGGSIVVVGTPVAAAHEPRPAVAELLALEDRFRLSSDDTYLRFAARAEHVRAEIGSLIRRLVADGNRVAGYGAPSKGSALLNACGLGVEEVSFCSDTTSLKQGKVLPGSRVPVWSPEQARAQEPDYYLLLAWNYADEILSKERAYLARGGRFIIPIPEPQIVSSDSLV
jgi:novobiocin biosynthesis protein NovU